jgi:peptidyl-prolyl cis-trans isomerase C
MPERRARASLAAAAVAIAGIGCHESAPGSGRGGSGERAPAGSAARPSAPAGARGPERVAPQGAAELATPLAKIDDVTITLGELQDQINRQSPYVRARYTSLEQKRELLDSLVRFEVLAKEAARRGLDRDPEVVRTMKQVMIQRLMRDELDSRITAESVPEAELRAYYDANLAEFNRPEEVRASAVIVRHRAQAERVAAEARGEAGRTNKGFRDLVMRYSTDEDTKLRGGDLRFFDAASTELPAAVVKGAFALVSTGDVSTVIDAGDGAFYVLKQTGRRRATTRSFDDVKPQIRNKLFRERRLAAQRELVEALRSKAKIEIDDANLAKVRVDPSAAGEDGQAKDLLAPPPPTALPADPTELPGGGPAPAPGAPGPPPGSPPPRAPGNP